MVFWYDERTALRVVLFHTAHRRATTNDGRQELRRRQQPAQACNAWRLGETVWSSGHVVDQGVGLEAPHPCRSPVHHIVVFCRELTRLKGRRDWMKAIAVYPGMPHSMLLEEVPMPAVTDIPDGRGVLVKVLRVGVDGTDKEINEAKYGQAPEGERFLITGNENFGQVVAVGPNVPDTIKPGSYVVATVRRPGHSIYDTIGLQDMTTDDVYYERGINLRHGYLTEYYVEDAAYIVPLPETVRNVGVLLEPLTVAEKGLNQAFEIQRRLKVWQPRRAAVLGSGTIGLLAAPAMRLRGLEVTC